jgi:hypothetical protein
MRSYVVLYWSSDNKLLHPYICLADNPQHAVNLFMRDTPGRTHAWVKKTDMVSSAVDEYMRFLRM